MFTLTNCGHQHSTVYEAKVCIGLIQVARPFSPPPPPVPFKDQPGTMSESQRKYLVNLGATSQMLTRADGNALSMNEASKLIDDFKNGKVTAPVTEPAPISPAPSLAADPRLEFVKAMMDSVPDGYFAVRREEGETLSFVRVSTPKTGKFKGARKVQSQHTDNLVTRGALWPSGRWSIYAGFNVEHMLLIIADAEACGIRYARHIKKCCRCNAALTDERSRYYGIGPECEKHWPHILNRVEADNGPYWHGKEIPNE